MNTGGLPSIIGVLKMSCRSFIMRPITYYNLLLSSQYKVNIKTFINIHSGFKNY